jgi:hypothetical protein
MSFPGISWRLTISHQPGTGASDVDSQVKSKPKQQTQGSGQTAKGAGYGKVYWFPNVCGADDCSNAEAASDDANGDPDQGCGTAEDQHTHLVEAGSIAPSRGRVFHDLDTNCCSDTDQKAANGDNKRSHCWAFRSRWIIFAVRGEVLGFVVRHCQHQVLGATAIQIAERGDRERRKCGPADESIVIYCVSSRAGKRYESQYNPLLYSGRTCEEIIMLGFRRAGNSCPYD